MLNIRREPKIAILLHSAQTGSGAHPALFQWVPGALSPGIKPPGREADYSPPTSARSRKCGSLHPLPLNAFMVLEHI
jgi:hypothetical protein